MAVSQLRIVNPLTSLPFEQVAARGAETTGVTDRQIAMAGTTLGAVTVLLPAVANLLVGMMFAAFDADGNAATNNVTVNGNGTNIDGSATDLIETNGTARAYVYDGNEFRRVTVRRTLGGGQPERLELAVDVDAGGTPAPTPLTPAGTAGDVQINGGAVLAAATGVKGAAGCLKFGTTPGNVGALRMGVGAGIVQMAFGAAGSEAAVITTDSVSSIVTLGTFGNLFWTLANYQLTLRAFLNILINAPMLGNSTPFSVHGAATQAMADANQVLPAAVYSRKIVRLTGVNTVLRTATFPHPSSDDESYIAEVWCQTTVAGCTISTGTGTTVNLLAAGVDSPARILITPAGCTLGV